MTARQHPIGSDMGRGPSGEAVEELPILQGLDPLASLPPHRRVALTHTQIRRAWNGRLRLRHEFSSLLKERISRSISKISHILRRRDPVVASASPLLCQLLDVPWRSLSATFVQWKDRYQTRARFDCDELPPHRANFSISALHWDLLRR